MSATFEKIKNFLDSPVSYALIKNKDLFRDHYYAQSYSDALPMTDHYYHPLNPCFLFELTGPAIMQHSPIITIRDGYLSFMDFLLNNHQAFNHWNTLFLVPKVYEKLIPPHLASFFIGYDFSQEKNNRIERTGEKFIFAYLTEEYLGNNIEECFNKIALSPEDRVTLFLPQETNLEKVSYNNIFAQEFIFKLSHKLKDHSVRHINTHDFLNTSDFSSYDFIDLAPDHALVYDNFIKFLMASRGCQSVFSSRNQTPLLTLNVSMFHQMNLYEIKPHNDIFSELLLFKKQNPNKKLLEDSYFSGTLRHFMKSSPHET